jgi:dipeptidyl aminopeptidase/acylaminoacyl peptidase
MRSIFTRAGMFLFLAVSVFSSASAQAQKTAPKPISYKDVSSWKAIQNFSVTLSPDGQWMLYALHPVEGDGELVLQKVNDTIKRAYPIGGSPSFRAEFSEDGKWLAFKEFPKDKERKAAAKSPGKTLFEKLWLVNLASWEKTDYEKAGNFSFNGRASSQLAVQLMKEKGPGAGTNGGNDLLLVDLATKKTFSLGNVGDFGFNKAGDWMAYTIDAAGQTGNGIHLMNVANRQITVIDNDKASYSSLNWNEEGTAFAALKMVKDEKFKADKGSVIGVKNISASPAVTVFDPFKNTAGFPAGMTVSPNRRPTWSDDLGRLMFGIQKLEPGKKEEPVAKTDSVKKDSLSAAQLAKLRSDTSIKSIEDLQKALAKINADGKTAPRDTVKPDMTIWHWKDKRLQSNQQVNEMNDKRLSDLAVYDVASFKFIRVQDSSLTTINVLPKQLYALAQDDRSYQLERNLSGQNYTDVYVVNLRTGEKQKVMDNFYVPGFASMPRGLWNGTQFVYGMDGHFHVYDIPTGKSANITAKVPTSFVDTEDDHNVTKPMQSIVDISKDSKYLLIGDLWDIWQVPVNTTEAAKNLTVNGAAERIRYMRTYQLDLEAKGYDPAKPLYIGIYGEWTKKSGIALIGADKKGLKPGAELLKWEDASLTGLRKAKNAEVYLFSREKFNMPTEFYVSSTAKLTDDRKVSSNAPLADKYAWSSGVQLVNYVSDKGDSLQGTLFLPANYEKGKKYPTIVYYYEKMSQTAHSWTNPSFNGGGWNPTMYTSNGYAVFMPDIVYKLDDPGMSAVWCVLPAVKAAIATGVIDADRIGITGHSWGGYQTCFLATQTTMFKAAAAGAPLTNLISMYDLIYWNSGGGNMAIFEASQGRFRGAPWENWDAYLRNSPIYHVKKVAMPLLMLHNDRDGAVDFTQGIEFYNALRRLKKPVVLMQYKGENHGLAKLENRKDYSVRMIEFFDHHLKGVPALEWLSNGIDRLKLDEHLNKVNF